MNNIPIGIEIKEHFMYDVDEDNENVEKFPSDNIPMPPRSFIPELPLPIVAPSNNKKISLFKKITSILIFLLLLIFLLHF